MKLNEQYTDNGYYIFDGCENIDLWLDANWDDDDNNYDTWCSMSEEMYGVVMMAVGPLNYYYDVNPAAAACCCVADGYEIENCEEEITPEFDDPCTDFNQLNSTFQSQICDSQCPGSNAWCVCCPEEENEQNGNNIHMYEVYSEQGASNDIVTWGIGADPEDNYGNVFSLGLAQQAEDFYNEAGQPSEEQFIKLLGQSFPSSGVCFRYIGMHDFGSAPGDYVGYSPAMGTDNTNNYVEGPFNSFEECWADENTTEFDMSTCEYPFNTYSPETQNNLCNTFYSGQGSISDATWNNLLNNILGPNGECCPDQEIVEPEEEEIEPFTPTTSIAMCGKFNSLTEIQQEKFCTKCEQEEPTLDPIYGPNQDQYWAGGPYAGLTPSDCKCCDKKPDDEGPIPIKPKKGGPIKLKESIIKRFQKLANIKK